VLELSMSWSKDLKNIIIENKNLTERQLRAGMFDAANTIILGSPVGAPELWQQPAPNYYRAGSYRSNHRISINKITSFEKDITSEGGVLMELQADIAKFKIGETLFMTNPLPYATAIEYGHSSQAPDGVYRPAVRRLIKFLNTELKVK
jgi:hypothetical protein